MRLLVIGGGIGGLTAALAAQMQGFEVAVFEQARALSGVGAGIQLSPNAMHVLRALGLEAPLRGAAFQPRAGEMRLGISGEPIMRFALGTDAETRWGAPYLHVHRADLIGILAHALHTRAPGALRLGQTLAGFSDTATGVTATLADASTVTGDVLVGADGLHSVVATQLFGQTPATDTGQIAWRAMVQTDALGAAAPPPTACAWVGRGRHAVTYYVRGGALVNFVGVVERESDAGEDWNQSGDLSRARADFKGWAPPITRLLETATGIAQWKLFARPPAPRFWQGSTVLLGDACHAMLPFMAQGAAMAIEDAYVLMDCLKQTAAHPAQGLEAYHQARHARTCRVVAASKANRARFHAPSTAARTATYGPLWLATRLAPGPAAHAAAGALDWLYGHNVVSPQARKRTGDPGRI
jgi:salicylate hydroxylase